jgi:hypothetical protein
MPRVRRHLQSVSIVWFIFAVYRLVTGLAGLAFFRAAATGRLWSGFGASGPWGPFGSHWMAALYPVIAAATVLMAGLSFLVAYGLTTRQPWGRMLAIIVAAISLFKFPFGTAIGIYTLWVLAPGESGLEYEAMSIQS